MSKPLDDDFNYDIKPSTPREARGGAFAPADMPLIKEALYALIATLDKDDNRVSKIASLLHRIGRVS
jgi:hypothetical protein